MTEQQEKRIDKNLKAVKICAIISWIIAGLTLASSVTIHFMFPERSIYNQINFKEDWFDKLVIMYICPINIAFIMFSASKDAVDTNTAKYPIIMSFIRLMFFVVMLFLDLIFGSPNIKPLAKAMGYTLWIMIPIYIADIFLFVNVAIDKKNQAEIDAEQKRKEEIRLKEQQKVVDSKNLLEQVGINFFVENYHIVKSLPIIDAIDSIKGDLPYEEKKKRVQAMKEIFQKYLEELVLSQIIEYNASATAPNNLEKAKKLLEDIRKSKGVIRL